MLQHRVSSKAFKDASSAELSGTAGGVAGGRCITPSEGSRLLCMLDEERQQINWSTPGVMICV